MAYFPFFVEIQSEKVVIAGGGDTAAQKAKVLAPFNPDLWIIAPFFSECILKLAKDHQNIRLVQREIESADLDGAILAVAATDSREENEKIYHECVRREIFCNTVDTPDLCTVIFPALIQDPPLTIAVSTQGSSPAAARYIRDLIKNSIPSNFSSVLCWLASKRGEVKQKIGTQKKRAVLFQNLFNACLKENRPLCENEYENLLKEACTQEEVCCQEKEEH